MADISLGSAIALTAELFPVDGMRIQMPPGPARDLAVVNGGVMSEQLIHTKVEPPAIRRSRRGLRGQKPPLKIKEIRAIRIRLQLEERIRDLAMFNRAIDSKLDVFND